MRTVRLVGLATVLLAVALVDTGGSRGQNLRRPEEQLAAIYTLRVQLEIEQRQLDTALQRHSDVARARARARDRVARLYLELD